MIPKLKPLTCPLIEMQHLKWQLLINGVTHWVFFLQRGNVFLVDYRLLDGLPANTVNGKQNYLTAPLVLLHLNSNNRLLPVAIQVNPPDLRPSERRYSREELKYV